MKPGLASDLARLVASWAQRARAWLRDVFDPTAEKPDREQMYVRLAVQLELQRPQGERAKSILLTSPWSELTIRDTAMELAYTVAAVMGRRVLLIDADFAVQGEQAVPGLSDVLAKGVDELSSAVQPTSHERVFLLCAGSPEHMAGALAAGRHEELLKRACSAYESVIVMGAPVLRDSRWLMLAPFVDHSLLLAVEGRTHVSDLDTSLAVLADCKAAGVGVVLTREPHPTGPPAFG